MNEIEIIKTIMKSKGLTGAMLANKLGHNTPSAVTNRLQSKTMTVEVLIRLVDSLDCELIIRDKVNPCDFFVVDNTNRRDPKVYKSSNTQ